MHILVNFYVAISFAGTFEDNLMIKIVKNQNLWKSANLTKDIC